MGCFHRTGLAGVLCSWANYVQPAGRGTAPVGTRFSCSAMIKSSPRGSGQVFAFLFTGGRGLVSWAACWQCTRLSSSSALYVPVWLSRIPGVNQARPLSPKGSRILSCWRGSSGSPPVLRHNLALGGLLRSRHGVRRRVCPRQAPQQHRVRARMRRHCVPNSALARTLTRRCVNCIKLKLRVSRRNITIASNSIVTTIIITSATTIVVIISSFTIIITIAIIANTILTLSLDIIRITSASIKLVSILTIIVIPISIAPQQLIASTPTLAHDLTHRLPHNIIFTTHQLLHSSTCSLKSCLNAATP